MKHFRMLSVPRAFACAMLFLLAAPALLHADTVVLKNGDRLTGTAVKLEGGKLVFKTAYADPIAIAWDQVASLNTSQPLVLPTAGKTLAVTAVERTATGLTVTTASGPVTLDPVTLTVLRSPADQQAYEASLHPNWGHDWAGAASVSAALTSGNSRTFSFGTGLALARPTRTDKTSLYMTTLYNRDKKAELTTAESTTGGLRYDHNLNPKLFAFGTGDFMSDELQYLNLRSMLGGGFGWHAIVAPKQNFDILGGVVWTRESYSTIPAAVTLTVPTPPATNSFAALDVGEQYTRELGAASLFTEQAFFYPDLSQTSQYQFALNSSFSTKIGKIFTWQTTFTDHYTSFPPTGTQKNDALFSTGLGITLARH